ncbi:MAG TPA: SGNH/GDSL hydrolase family protein [Micromonosporaceae bacterium]|nr:SGNH/GDSL hydrolase family protein [Micromonosporaceae bacterium]
MRLIRRSLVPLAALLGIVLVAPPPAAADAGPPPSSIASMGDSITRAFNACGWFVDCPSRSYSTGDYSSVNTHYSRILRVNPLIQGRSYNHGQSGARVDDMPGQAQGVVGRNAEYVTILIGANDACTSTEAGMTPVSTFRAHFDTALATLKSGLPNARILVVSIPNVHRLWEVGRVSFSAVSTWSLFGICQSLLANPNSFAQADIDRRNRVRQRVADFNAQMAQACVAYGTNCRFDNNAVFNYPFVLSQVSGWDYFHPNTAGQAILASVSYANGYNW